jgi:alpha-amylase
MAVPYFQIIHFHFTIPLKEISFLEVQSATTLYDEALAETLFASAYKQEIKAKLMQLEKAVKDKEQVMVYFSSSFLSLLEKEDPDKLEEIAYLVKKERIILIGSCAYSSFSYLCHAALFTEEVKLHQQHLQQYFNYDAKYFINTACLYDNQLAELLQPFHYETVIATANNWHLAGRQASQLFLSAGKEALQIILANGDGNAQQQFGLVNGYGSAYSDEAFQSISKETLPALKQKNAQEGHIYSVSLPISSPEWQYNIPQYMANPLQKSLVQEGHRLMEVKGGQLKATDLKTLMFLFQPEQLLKMNHSSQASSYQHFIHSMNILTAIGLKVA